MKYSDIIIPRGAENEIAISFITENLKNRLKGLKPPHYVMPKPDEALEESKTEFRAVDQSILRAYPGRVFVTADAAIPLEKLYTRMHTDTELLPLHLGHLTASLRSLFSSLHPNRDPVTWQALNQELKAWDQDLASCLEYLPDASTCEHLTLFLPEVVTPETLRSLAELVDTVRLYSFIHSISDIHVVTPFLTGRALAKLSELQTFKTLQFYTAYITDDLEGSHLFRKDLAEHKVREFGGNFERLSYQSFYQ